MQIVRSQVQSASAGNNGLGFPFMFYEYLGGKRSPEPTSRHIVNFGALAMDIAIAGITSLLIVKVVTRKSSR